MPPAIISGARTVWRVLNAWVEDQCLRKGASIGFYSIFSLAPLLATAIVVAGMLFGVDAARSQIVSQIGGLVGQGGTDTLQAMIDSTVIDNTFMDGTGAERAAADGSRQWTSMIVGVCTLFIGATGVFLELRYALDSINKQSAELAHGLSWMLKARLISFALVLAIGFVALVSLALSAALSALAAWIATTMPLLATVVVLLDTLLSLTLITALFMLLLRWLPSVQPRRVALWPGALLSGVLFVLGKHLVGLYLGREGFTDAYGAAGSLVVLLIWVFYCSQVLLLGAEYNKVRADRLAPAGQPKTAAEQPRQDNAHAARG